MNGKAANKNLSIAKFLFEMGSKAKDPHQLRVNSYRVLLTRGRDGFIVFVPPEEKMENTFESLSKSGLKLL